MTAKELAAPDRKRVVGYLPTYRLPYTGQWSKITHLCLAFGNVRPDGSLDISGLNTNAVSNLVTQAHANGVQVLVSLGGGASNGFSDVLLDETKRKTLVNALPAVLSTLRVDGIDFDYEEWDGDSAPAGASARDLLRRDALEQTYRDARALLGDDVLLAAAVSGSYNTSGWGTYNCFSERIHEALDFVSLMLYDMTGPWASSAVGQHASFEFYEGAVTHWLVDKKTPKQKLVAGVPFYGYLFQSATSAEGATAMSYGDIVLNYPNQDAQLKDNIGLLYYNGQETVRRKSEYVVANDLGGIMIWELGQDSSQENLSLLNVIDQTLQ